jgi:Uma2 family endonuclease
MVRTLSKPLTLEEFLKLPETKPASEHINGQIIQKPMPQGEHSTIRGELVTAINAVVKPQRIARAFLELRCTFGGRSTVPDVSVFTWHRIPRDENGEIANVFLAAPNWTIEVLSPAQSQTKVTKNILHCLKYGTQMGWLIAPDEQTVFVYFLK